MVFGAIGVKIVVDSIPHGSNLCLMFETRMRIGFVYC